MSGHSISVNTLGKTQDNIGLERDTAQSTTIYQALSGNSDVTNLPELGSTVGHLLIHEVGHLESQLLDQVIVQVGGARCRDVG